MISETRDCIGKRVRLFDNSDYPEMLDIGDTGTIVGCFRSHPAGWIIKVEWDTYIGGHNCDGHAKEGYGWNVPAKRCDYIEDLLNIEELI